MNLESSKSTKGLAIYDLFGYHASRASVSAAILDFEKCSRVNSIYPTDYVYGISRTSKSVEKKTISIKSGFSLKITFGCLTNRVGLPPHNTPFPGLLIKSIGAAFYDRMPFLTSTTCVGCSIKVYQIVLNKIFWPEINKYKLYTFLCTIPTQNSNINLCCKTTL